MSTKIVRSATFVPTHVDPKGNLFNANKADPLIIPNEDPEIPARVVPRFRITYSDGLSTMMQDIPRNSLGIKQIGGVGFGAGLDVDNWVRENAGRDGMVCVVIRDTHGELYR